MLIVGIVLALLAAGMIGGGLYALNAAGRL
jgi:hypothetical protein